MANRSIPIVFALVAFSIPAAVRGEPSAATEAASLLSHLAATSSPELRPIWRGDRVTWLGGLAEPTSAADPETATRDFLYQFGPLAGLDGAADLEVHSLRDYAGTTFVRYQVQYRGRPILGAQVVMSVRDGLIRHVASSRAAWTGSLGGATISAEQAGAAVEAFAGAAGRADELAWLPLSGQLVPVWVVALREPGHDWRYIVEATTGTVLWRHDQFLSAEGFVYEPNPVASGGEVSRVELPRLTSAEALEGELARSFQCVGETGTCTGMGADCQTCGQREHYALAQPDGNFLYPPDEPNLADPFAEVQAYYHVDWANNWFSEELDFAVSCGGRRSVDVHVNHNVPGDPISSANAFYGDANGDGCGDITLGEGRGVSDPTYVDLAYDGDVIYHEFTHGIVQAAGGLGCSFFGVCLDDLGMDWTSLGLNEGYADYFAVAMTGDPVLGEHAGQALSEGEGMVRNAANDHLCPFDLIGESHYDGEIWAAVGWDIRQAIGEVADQIMLAALVAMSSDSGFAEAAEAVHEAAQTHVDSGVITEAELAAIDAILGPEGRAVMGCERIVPLDAVPEGHHDEYMILYSWGGMALPTGLHWSLTAPRRAESLRIEVADFYDSAEALTFHVRRNEPVAVGIGFEPGVGMSLTFEEDFVASMPAGVFEMTLESDPAIEEDTTYYFVLEYRCTRGCLLRVSGDVTGAPNQLPTAVVGDDLEVPVGATVNLDGSGSSNPDGDELTYSWSLVSGPDVTVANSDQALASFLASDVGDYVLQLTVTDLEGGTGEAQMAVRAVPSDEIDGGVDGSVDDGASLNVGGGGCGCTVNGSNRTSTTSALIRTLLF